MKKNRVKCMVIFYLFCFISCEKKQQNTVKIESLKLIVNNNLGKKLIIPDSLELYHPFPNSINYKESVNSNLKIYSHIDASCGTCVESLKSWNNLIPELNQKNIQVILICSSNNRFELLKYYFESKEIVDFSYPLLLDHKGQFLKQNSFMSKNKNFETVMTNADNKILLIGNLTYSTKIKELYFKEIEKYESK